MDFLVTADGYVAWREGRARCALGRAGIVPEADKREGDGATPAGIFPIRRVLYRADRLARPKTALTVLPIEPGDGWCDAPADPAYNRPVKLPYPASAEALWRADHLYDLCVVLGHNDGPVRPGLGSAIFLHLAWPDYRPTEGCIAVTAPDMERLLRIAAPVSRFAVSS